MRVHASTFPLSGVNKDINNDAIDAIQNVEIIVFKVSSAIYPPHSLIATRIVVVQNYKIFLRKRAILLVVIIMNTYRKFSVDTGCARHYILPDTPGRRNSSRGHRS